MYSAYAIDDNRESLNMFEKAFNKISGQLNAKISILYFSDPVEFMSRVNDNPPDIAVIDIVLGNESGVSLAEKIKACAPTVKLVFVTAFYEYAPDIFSTVPQGLLYKPLDEENLLLTFNRMIDLIKKEQNDYFVVRSGGVMFNIRFANLMYVECNARKISFHEVDRITQTTGKIGSYAELLPGYFLQSHKSFIVNVNFVRSLKGLDIELLNGETIPLSKHRSASFKNEYFDMISGV